MEKLFTLCLAHQHPKILLAMKKRGFGKDRWNGLGGKVQEGETIEEAARREVTEEANIKINKMEKTGIIDFRFRGKPEIIQVHIFNILEFSGEPSETEEMKPKWFHVNEIPFNQMWDADSHWIPLFLEKKKFKGDILFDESDKVLEHNIIEVENI